VALTKGRNLLLRVLIGELKIKGVFFGGLNSEPGEVGT